MILDKLKGVMIIVHSILMMLTFAVTYVYFAETSCNEFPDACRALAFELPEICYPIVMIGVVWVSVVTALFHIIGGGIMGATAGGVLMGMKMGLFLGLAYSLGRLWIYAGAAFGASLFYWPEFKWSIILLGVLTVIFLVIQKVTTFVWSKIEGQ
jgi:hypothetical protein